MSNKLSVARSDEEVNDLLNNARTSADNGLTRFSCQSYEDGILAAIDWLFGDTDDHPYPEE